MSLVSVATVLLAISLASCASERNSADYTREADLAQLIDRGSGGYVLLDVRSPAEYASGHIPTAVNIPYDTIGPNSLAADKGELVITYCVSGRRASIAETTLRSLGYTNVVNFGGIGKWTGKLVEGE
jgi:rhodanese-related sulfurtransferase